MTANGKARFGDGFPEPIESVLNSVFHGDEIDYSKFPGKDLQVENDIDGHVMNQEELETLQSINESSGVSKLEPPETTSAKYSKWSYRGRFMAGKEEEYEATLSAYKQIAAGKSCNHVHALQGCRTFANFQRDSVTGDVMVFGDSCRDRWCPMCAGQKASYAREQVETYIKNLNSPRFLTLTLRNNESSLKHQVTFLQQSFSKLRTRAYWKKHVTGGVWFLEIKRGKNSRMWHPHLHILLDGEYMEQGRLSALWEQVTFGSPIIDISKISDIEKAAKYVSKYCSKPAMLKNYSSEDRCEIIEAMFRKRLCGTFGTAKTVTLTPPKVESDADWQYIGSFDDIVEKAEHSLPARAIMIAYSSGEPLSEGAFEDFTGHPPGYIDSWTKPKPPDRQLWLDFYKLE